jgi:hypothetical protein
LFDAPTGLTKPALRKFELRRAENIQTAEREGIRRSVVEVNITYAFAPGLDGR